MQSRKVVDNRERLNVNDMGTSLIQVVYFCFSIIISTEAGKMEKVDLLIRNGKVFTETGFYDLDVAAIGEKIAFISKPGVIPDGKKTIDARGKYVLPGIIDWHTHLREPGFTHKEDF